MAQHIDLPLLFEAVHGPPPRKGHDAGVEDQDMQRALTRQKRSRSLPDRGKGGKIEDQRLGGTPGRCVRQESGNGIVSLLPTACADDDVEAMFEETLAGLEPKPSIASGDQGHLPFIRPGHDDDPTDTGPTLPLLLDIRPPAP